ncbi:T cell receptor alpha chain MC.7.G5-like isoform X1 [Oreochromis aureus]|uniref:T cell receptor alpha chain MC.7.G5-like isoform X1 n=1 Tax=Oreochromis aureus TaxID=47969 RepID=UPI001954C7ED|nr:T cell receptor alpha chain MC.7.G5-like isoform X1 [Oreochromis aureus]
MEHWLWIILAALFFECKGEDKVIQEQGDVIAAEGVTVTLDCRYETTDAYPYLFWYKQEINEFPKYVLRRDTTGTEDNDQEFPKDRFDAKINKIQQSVPLKIQKLHLSDSAVYYCALQPTGGNYRLYFGKGTKLIVQTGVEYKPSYFKLGEGSNTACLATGFSRHNAASNQHPYFQKFNTTKAVAISPNLDLYNQVVFPGDDAEDCESPPNGDSPCVDVLEPDPKVNLMSLTILALRVIFIKTIIFNIIMTLRLWISQ